ncbi:MAG: hypothetical protein OEM59_08470, partial [Rhodospirillales bacterium]|nr:hypothetical protein [Rhodospirillales bacterium]
DGRDAVIGEVRSRAFSPRLNKYIGYAMLPTEPAEAGTRVRLSAEWAVAEARVVPLPFVRTRARDH